VERAKVRRMGHPSLLSPVDVADAAAYLLKRGFTPEQMRRHYSDRPLTLAEVHSALAYYYDNTDEIEALIQAGDRWEEEFEQRKARLVSDARAGRWRAGFRCTPMRTSMVRGSTRSCAQDG
jgi:hypothetical protein